MDLGKIGLFIAEMRKKKKLTQQELADKLGVTDKAISNWENGRRMPDVSLYKVLCKELDITLNELINGEIEHKKITRESVDETIIKTLNYNEENKRKLNRIIKILILVLCILVIFIGGSYYAYRKRYPKIDIYKISIVENESNELVDQLIPTNDSIMYYSLDSVLVCNTNNKCFDLLTALINKQTSMKKIREFLDRQTENNYVKKFSIYDNEITTYKSNIYDVDTNINKSNQFEVIFCNNANQVYFGKMHMENELQGKYCGILEDNRKEFTRTYKIISVTPDNAEEYVNAVITQFQLGELISVKIPSNFDIKEGKNYEFTFTTYETFEDTIENIFKYTTIKEVKETDKTGLEQIQQPINANNK